MRLVKMLMLLFGLFRLSQARQAVDTVSASQNTVNVFIDCGYSCDMDYIKTELSLVNYVRDPNQADIHILVTQQSTGGGGSEFTFAFIGKNKFVNSNTTIKYVAAKSNTQEETRKGMVRTLTLGLVPYIAQTTQASQITVTFKKEEKKKETIDTWDHWVFTLSANSFFNGEKSSSFLNGWSNVTASRTTAEWKIRLNTNTNYNEEHFEFQDTDTTTFSATNVRRSHYFESSVIRSIDSNWSAGFFISAYQNTFSNIEVSASGAPAVEYNIFPYSESTRRQLRLSYRIGIGRTSYVDTTVYFKREETLFSQNLSATLDLKQTWGSTSLTLGYSQYLHDGTKNNFRVSGSASIRLFEGLTLNLYGGYQAIHDQLSLPKAGASVTDVLRQQRQLETSYSFWGSFGISYSFGSIFSAIVNPRFGGGGGGSTIIFSD
jgi:hypothetical protein